MLPRDSYVIILKKIRVVNILFQISSSFFRSIYLSQLVRSEVIDLIAELAADGNVLPLGGDLLKLLGAYAAQRVKHTLAAAIAAGARPRCGCQSP